MVQRKGYGQFCPVAQAAEILAERWTPLVIRELCCGSTRFNDLQRGVPRMSPSLLSRRLHELAHAGIVEIVPADAGRGSEYRLTPAGAALFPVIEQMGNWAVEWLRHQLTADRNLDPDLLMWDIRRRAMQFGDLPGGRHVIKFELTGVPVKRRFYWLVLDGADTDLCFRNPGFEVDLRVGANLRLLTRIWLGEVSIRAAAADGGLRLEGSREAVRAFGKWFTLSHFASQAA
jgi:DNA-binding HxlR family transcriptional regulator